MATSFFPMITGGNFYDQIEQAATLRDADPVARAVTDDEAERFYCATVLVQSLNWITFELLCRGLGVPVPKRTAAGRKHAGHRILRMWRQPAVREQLEFMVANSSLGRVPDVGLRGDEITPWHMADLYQQGENICWIVRSLRLTGQGDIVDDFLECAGDWALIEYRFYLDLGRLLLSKLVLQPQAVSKPAPEAPPEQHLQKKLHTKAAQAEALERDVAGLKQERQDLAALARLVDDRLLRQVEQVRLAVAAAQDSLARRRADQARELQQLDRSHREKVQHLRGELSACYEQLGSALSDRERHIAARPLSGITLAVQGEGQGRREGYRLLAESLGARLVPPGAEAQFTLPDAGLPAFERALRALSGS